MSRSTRKEVADGRKDKHRSRNDVAREHQSGSDPDRNHTKPRSVPHKVTDD